MWPLFSRCYSRCLQFGKASRPGGGSVVADEDDEGIAGEAFAVDGVDEAAELAVHLVEDCVELLEIAIGGIAAVAVHEGGLGIEGVADVVGPELEVEGAVAMAVDEIDAAVDVDAGGFAFGGVRMRPWPSFSLRGPRSW